MDGLVPQTKAQGQMLGRTLIGGGLLGAGYAAFAKSKYGAAVLIGATGVSVGMWLTNKLYLNDPEARAEYRRNFLAQKFSLSLGSGSTGFKTAVSGGTAIQNILKFAEVSDLAAALQSELQNQPVFISIPVKLYGVTNLSELVDVGAVSTRFFAERFENEVSAAGSFTQFWWKMGPGSLDELAGSSVLSAIVNYGLLRDMFLREYFWVDPSTGALLACAPDENPEDDDTLLNLSSQVQPLGSSVTVGPAGGTVSPTAGGSHGVWASVSSYGSFVQNRLNIQKTMLIGIVESCPFARSSKTTMAQMHAAGTISLFDQGYLSSSFVENKLTAELQSRSITPSLLQEYNRSCDLRILLTKKVIKSTASMMALRDLFAAGIPKEYNRSLSSSSSSFYEPTSEQNIIAFIEEWDSVLEKHPDLIPDNLKTAMVFTFKTYQEEKKKIEAAWRQRKANKERRDRDEKEERKRLEDNPRHENRRYNEDHKNRYGDCSHTSDADLRDDIRRAKVEYHDIFVDSLKDRNFGSRPFTRDKDCCVM